MGEPCLSKRQNGRKQINNMSIYAGHANRAITGGGNVPGRLAKDLSMMIPID